MEGPDRAYFERLARWSSTGRYRAEIEALWATLGLRAGARILDVGCGVGTALRLLKERGAGVTGIDRSPAFTAACLERPVSRADAACLPFPDATFDAVTFVHVVDHLHDPVAALDEARRVLRAGGQLGLVTPNLSFLRIMRLVPLSRYRPDPTVERHYTLGGIVDLVSRAGFTIRTARSWGPPPPLVPLSPFRERLLVAAARP